MWLGDWWWEDSWLPGFLFGCLGDCVGTQDEDAEEDANCEGAHERSPRLGSWCDSDISVTGLVGSGWPVLGVSGHASPPTPHPHIG